MNSMLRIRHQVYTRTSIQSMQPLLLKKSPCFLYLSLSLTMWLWKSKWLNIWRFVTCFTTAITVIVGFIFDVAGYICHSLLHSYCLTVLYCTDFLLFFFFRYKKVDEFRVNFMFSKKWKWNEFRFFSFIFFFYRFWHFFLLFFFMLFLHAIVVFCCHFSGNFLNQLLVSVQHVGVVWFFLSLSYVRM